MKIFNKENGKEKVYVQMQDIMTIIHEDINCGIPGSIIEKVFGKTLIVDESNRWNFKVFDLPEEVEFFKKLDWIVDYKEHRNKSREDAIAYSEEVNAEFNELAEKWNAMTTDERKANTDLYTRCTLLQYKIDVLPRVYWIGQGHVKLDLPNVIDNDGYDCGSNEEYEAKVALDPNKVIIRRKDGQPLNKGKVKRSYIKEVIANSLVNLEDARAGLCTAGKTKYSVSEDGMYIVIEIGVKPILSQEEKDYKKQNSFARRMVRKFTGSQEQ